MVGIGIDRAAIAAVHVVEGPGNTTHLARIPAPCYVGALEPLSRDDAYPLSTTNIVRCQQLSSRHRLFFVRAVLVASLNLLPQLGIAQEPTETTKAPQQYEPATLPKPDFRTRLPRTEKPELGEYNFTADSQTKEGNTWHLRGRVVIEGALMILKADEIDLNEDTHETEARGHVFFQHFERNEIIVCGRAEYNTETQIGKFYDGVKGYTKTKINAHPGTLTSDNPFYFEGKWAERVEDKYILHDGMITGCELPHPWWTLTGPKFDIIPEDRALAYKAIYRLRKVPLFYAPVFYKSLKKEPRQSGFLTPNFGNSSTRGIMLGIGYYWAINRSYDVLYHLQDFTARGLAHHVEFRGKPTQTSDFDAIFYGVQDSGVKINNTIQKQGGIDVYMTGRAELGNGWTARGNVNYLSSLVFRQSFTESYNEAIFSESRSAGYLSKHFDSFTFNTVVSRLENFQDATKDNFILIRKLPEVQFASRDRELLRGWLPVWGFFDSSAGLLYRREPIVTFPNGVENASTKIQTEQFSRRATADPGVVTAFHWGGFHLVPSFALHEAYYSEERQSGQTVRKPLLRNAPEISVVLIMPTIERTFKKKTWLGDQAKHVIEPRATYRYVTGISDYNDTVRYDQNDLFSNTNELDLSLTNRLYAKRGETISEVFTWEISQKRFFDPTFGGAVVPGQRNVVLSTVDFTGYTFLDGPRSYSPVVSSLRANPILGVSFEWRTDYDPLFGRLVNSSFSTEFRRKKYFISAGHNMVHSDPVLSPSANQLRTTAGYGDPNRRGFNTASTLIYDYRQNFLTYASSQVNYNTDCCGISVQYRRFSFGTRNENQFRVAFSIANVGSFGTLKKQERLF